MLWEEDLQYEGRRRQSTFAFRVGYPHLRYHAVNAHDYLLF